MTFGIKGARNWKNNKKHVSCAAAHYGHGGHLGGLQWKYTATLQVYNCYNLPTQLGAIYE